MAIAESRLTRPSGVRSYAHGGAGLWLLLLSSFALSAEKGNCHVGAYRLADGTTVDIAPSESNTLRWRRFDGTTGALTGKEGGLWVSAYGWTGRADGRTVRFSDCSSGRIRFQGHLKNVSKVTMLDRQSNRSR